MDASSKSTQSNTKKKNHLLVDLGQVTELTDGEASQIVGGNRDAIRRDILTILPF